MNSLPQRDSAANSQLELFESRLPRRPYCTDELGRLDICTIPHALRRRYIQVNPPHLRFWAVFDIDRPGAALAWDDAGLPPPSWSAMNPQNAHAHSAWGLSAPVLVSDAARREPLRYLVAVEAAYREALQADPAYGGLITKNPAHKHWKVMLGRPMLYELGELAEFVDLPRHLPRRGQKPESVGVGRNVTVFDSLRHWSYKEIRGWKTAATQGAFIFWQQACYQRALSLNGDLPHPMMPNECWHIAKSVAKWTWNRFDVEASDRRFSELQSARGKRGGRPALDSQAAEARRMKEGGLSYSKIADRLSVGRRSVIRWCQKP